jgi:hypothetical protein
MGPLGAHAADDPKDPALAGSQWEGYLRVVTVKKPRPTFQTFDARLTVTKRDGEEFTGEFAWDRGQRVIQIVGVIERNETVKFTVAKELRGEGNNDLVANGRFLGRLKNEEIRGRFAVPNVGARYGDIGIKLKK